MAFDINSLGGLGMDIEMSSTPLLTMLQKGSAEVDETHADYGSKGIPGAKAGDIIYKPDGTLYKEIEILPIKNIVLYVEWKPKSAGGGLVAHHQLDVIRNPAYRPRDPNDAKSKEMLGSNELVQTSYWVVLFKHQNGEWTEGLLPFASTGLSASRAMGKLIRSFVYPETSRFKGKSAFAFSRSYILGSEIKRNEKGSWHAFSVKPGIVLDKKEDEALLESTAAYVQKADALLPSVGTAAKSLPAASTVDTEDGDAPF